LSLRNVALYAVIIIATVIAAESLARVWSWQPSAWWALGDGMGSLRYRHYSSGFGDLVPNQDGLWIGGLHRPYHVQTNSVGLRNTEEPSDDSFQILAVGDSTTFGIYLANDDTWPAWAESRLRQHYGNTRRLRVFNAGIIGYTIVDELSYLREKGVYLKPGLVVLGVFENDLSDLRRERNGLVQRPHDDIKARTLIWLKALARSSALFNVAERINSQMQLAAAGVDIRRGEPDAMRWLPYEVPPDQKEALVRRYGELFREMTALLKMYGIPLVVIFIPSAHKVESSAPSEMEPIVRALTAETGTPYLDLTAAVEAEQDAPERLYLLQRRNGILTGNAHMSREGHAVIARALVDWLIANELVSP
jgi:lysophospholipase L1-like esterase